MLQRARASHPCVGEHGVTAPSEHYDADAAVLGLTAVPGEARRLTFDGPALGAVRSAVAEAAREAGIGERKVDACVLAVNEIAANSVRHGGGRGELHLWREGDALVCEIRDTGVHRRPARRASPPDVRPARRPGPLDGQPALRPRPDPDAAERARQHGARLGASVSPNRAASG